MNLTIHLGLRAPWWSLEFYWNESWSLDHKDQFPRSPWAVVQAEISGIMPCRRPSPLQTLPFLHSATEFPEVSQPGVGNPPTHPKIARLCPAGSGMGRRVAIPRISIWVCFCISSAFLQAKMAHRSGRTSRFFSEMEREQWWVGKAIQKNLMFPRSIKKLLKWV